MSDKPIQINRLHAVWLREVRRVDCIILNDGECWLDVYTEDGNKYQTELSTKPDPKCPINLDELLATLKESPWQAFRELESNTRDEGGTTKLIEDDWRDLGVRHSEPNQTTIIVEHPEFVQAFHDRDDIFLPGALLMRGAASDARIQVIEKPSKMLYFRGLRVAETRKPAMFTYNFVTSVDLTEDRTIKYDFMVRAELARHVVTSTDKKFIEAVVTAPDDKWEHGLEFEYQNEPPTDEFREVIDRRKGAVSRSALRYMGGWSDSASYARPAGTFELYPRPWLVNEDFVADANGTLVLRNQTNLKQLLVDVVDAVNGAELQDEKPPAPDTTITTVDEALIPF